MIALAWAFDLMLAAGLVWLAWQALFSPRRFTSVVNFMGFYLLMALVWVRLDAPDIALAEAAIGSGVTGALLMSALGRLPAGTGAEIRPRTRLGPFQNIAILTCCLAMGWVAWAAHRLPRPGLASQVSEELEATGVEHSITAVLLNLRAFDTLLEIAIMLTAVVLVWSLGPPLRAFAPPTSLPGLPALSHLLHPIFLLVPAYLLWRGTHAPGGAFPAGALLGAGGVLLLLTDAHPWKQMARHPTLLHILLSAGVTIFLAVGLAGLLLTGSFLAFPPSLATALILAIEVTTALSIALMLMAFYLFGEPGR